MNLFNRGRSDSTLRDLVRISRREGWDSEDLRGWLNAPNSRFDDDQRPMDHLQTHPEAVISALEQTIADKW
ncbi:hypothetical protein D9V29_10130 [Mycetocola manganoxydans]|uniref:Antitoxin Xre/MbcA/ParS-like toxin-binding domain-containing protein n=1 Tax=Mycetocola manganoxydans TaxID=699879 RepID=A0A3L6ZRP9_9MICO|nr:hypothetical protein D9V29_10130 [Mycetocola manganoxydans]GHD49013.1 hypothetical protein GCM10008097_21370 [Mycetocola manganoxydans]